ncbi:MAG TPA: hypothetical protein V6D47_00180 [Oscillatoriaceae cyanobacterium]
MRDPYEGNEPYDRFFAALKDLENDANVHRFDGGGAFYAWERLNRLIGRLRAAFDLFELEHDLGPVQREIEDYYADLARLNVRPDPWVAGHLQALTDSLAPEPVVDLTTNTERPAPGAQWPPTYLTARPADLEALLRDRTPPGTPPRSTF